MFLVALIDHRPFTRRSVSEMLEKSIDNARILAVSSPAELVEQNARERTRVQMIIISLSGAEVRGDAFEQSVILLRSEMGDIPIIVLADQSHTADVAAALSKGVRGYLTTSLDLPVAIEALKLVQAGGTFVPACAFLQMLQVGAVEAVRDAEPATAAVAATGGSLPGDLTPRQMAVLDLLREGKPNKVIARELDMQECTVKVHIRQIMKKLNASNRTQAVIKASLLANSLKPESKEE